MKKVLKYILIGGAVAIAVEIPTMMYWNYHTDFKETMQQTGFDKPTVKEYLSYDGVELDYIYKYKENDVTPDILKRLNELQNMTDTDYRLITPGSKDPKGPEYLAFAKQGLSVSEALQFYRSGIKNPDDAKAIKEAQGIIFSNIEDLEDQRIPMAEAIPLLKQGITPNDIIIQYCEKLGLTQEERKNYARYGLNDEQMKVLIDHEITPAYASAILHSGWKDPIFKPEELTQYVQEGKITKDLMDEWHELKFAKNTRIDWRGKAMCIKYGYTPEYTKKWLDNQFSFQTMHTSTLAGYTLEEMIRTRHMMNLINAD